MMRPFAIVDVGSMGGHEEELRALGRAGGVKTVGFEPDDSWIDEWL